MSDQERLVKGRPWSIPSFLPGSFGFWVGKNSVVEIGCDHTMLFGAEFPL
jgi:hypothetical protein